MVGTTAVATAASTSIQLDFTSISLATGDVLYVLQMIMDGSAVLTEPASQGWVSDFNLSSGNLTAALWRKAWGQGATDDTTPDFGFTSASCNAVGWVVRGQKLSGGNPIAQDTDTAVQSGGGLSSLTMPGVTPTAAALIQRIALYDDAAGLMIISAATNGINPLALLGPDDSPNGITYYVGQQLSMAPAGYPINTVAVATVFFSSSIAGTTAYS